MQRTCRFALFGFHQNRRTREGQLLWIGDVRTKKPARTILPVDILFAGERGVLLAWGNVIDGVIKSGVLVPIIDARTPSNDAYDLVTNRRRTIRPEDHTFKQRLMQRTKDLR